ncbi:MAG: DUF5752 family protein [Candidatus Sulfotelmatobacter sp.]|jgi:hypothetical protein
MTAALAAAHSRVAAAPFYFNTSASLLRITQYKANNPSELLDGLQNCPDDSIFQHSIRTLQEHHFIREGFTNDFAHWAASGCNEPMLAEALAEIDVREFTKLAEIRGRFVHAVRRFLDRAPETGERPALTVFHFCASDIVVIPTTFVAHDLREFADGVRGVTVHSLHHHFIEARLRLNLRSNDFSEWLEDLGMKEAADELNRIDIYSATLEDVREQILRIVDRSLI